MKKNKITYRIFFLTVLIALVATSCQRKFDEINTNPNSPSGTMRVDFLMTGAQKGLMDHTWEAFWGAQVGGQLAQYWSSNQYASESRYQFRTAVTNNTWLWLYSGGLNDADDIVGGLAELQAVIDSCTADPETFAVFGDPNNQIAVALIMRTWAFQMITDTWGDVPYSEALLGAANTSPVYDSQRDIYIDLLNKLDDALDLIDLGAEGPHGDVVYNGDMAAWWKFANSLKLRIAMRMSDRESALASTAINEAVASGIFTSNADNAIFSYNGIDPNHNMYYQNRYIEARVDYAGSNILIDVMNTLSDPRLPTYVEPAASSGLFVGEVYGLTDGDAALTANGDVSQRSESILAADAPGIYMDYAETQFILAEAVERGYIAGDAETFYNSGISASFDVWAAGDATDYVAQANVDYSTLIGGGMTWKQVIGKQKWLALYTQGLQGWSEWRRLDFGILQLPAGGVLDGSGIPLRMYYPLDEQTLNTANYSAASAAMGGDTQDSRVWWDVE